MIKNLFVVAFRNLKRYPGYSLLNIFGLMIGITFSLFLIFYIRDELSYDKYHTKADRIYRLNSFIQESDREEMSSAITPFPTAAAIQAKFPEVEQSLTLVPSPRVLFKNGETRLFEEKIFYADSNFFKVFTEEIIEGNVNTALMAPNSIVLTEAVAIKYFGKAKGIIGKTLETDTKEVFTVKAIIGDVPRNSHLIFNALLSRSTLPKDFSSHWGNFGFYTYAMLRPGSSASAFEKKLVVLYDEYLGPIFKQFNVKIRFEVQRITDIHLRSNLASGEPEQTGSMSYIYIFSAVVVFMLLIACINYMNLTTARSARRAKEIGIRKVTGSSKVQLVMQFLVESTLITLIALLLSIGLVFLLLPTFNIISGKQIAYSALFLPSTFMILAAVVLIVGLIGGSYPAFYLSRLQPVKILKGNLSKSSSNVVLRRILVVTQFSVALIMLICTWVVERQLKFLRSRDLGFDKEQIVSVVVNSNKDLRSNILAFKNEIRSKHSNVKSVSSSSGIPGSGISFILYSIETEKGFVDQGVDNYFVDENYFSTMGMKVVEGRGFTSVADTLKSIVVNEKMVQQFGWKEPIGKKVRFAGDTSNFALEVVGVLKDFHQKSLYNPIAPLMLFYRPNQPNIQLKVAPGDVEKTLAGVEKSWNAFFPDLEFSYTFLDEEFNSQYAADQKRGTIYTSFSFLTILITCLGLLGLIAFTTEQRQKEISIRKILGAGLPQLVPMITKNFVVLVGVSCLIAFPVAYVFMFKWLKVFPYSNGLSVWPFVFSALMVLGITLATVMFHTVRAVVANPTRSLKAD